MKILYITTLETTMLAFFKSQINYLYNNGIEVDIACNKADALLKSFDNKEIRCYKVDLERGVSLKGTIKGITQLVKIIRQNEYDIVQYSTPNAAFCGAIASWISKTKVRNYHLMGLKYLGSKNFGKKILFFIEKLTCQLSTNIECVSKSNLDFCLKDKLFEDAKGIVVGAGSSGGIDLTRFDFEKRSQYKKEIREKYNIGSDKFVFGFAGRITKDKGVNELLSAYKQILDNGNKLILVGTFDNKKTLDEELLQWAENNDSVIFVGETKEIEKYFCAMDVLILPSYREGFGNVLIEAQAMGTPVITSNIPGPIDAIIENETGLLCEPKSTSSLLESMKSFIKIKNKDEISFNAKEFARKNFDENQLNKQILIRKNELYNLSKKQD